VQAWLGEEEIDCIYYLEIFLICPNLVALSTFCCPHGKVLLPRDKI
jgi:hypothetical protein